MDKIPEAIRITAKERGRLASQRHREAQKKRGIPDARQIDDVLLAIFVGLAAAGGLRLTAENRGGAITAVMRASGWDAENGSIRSAIERRFLVHEERYRSFKPFLPKRVEPMLAPHRSTTVGESPSQPNARDDLRSDGSTEAENEQTGIAARLSSWLLQT